MHSHPLSHLRSTLSRLNRFLLPSLSSLPLLPIGNSVHCYYLIFHTADHFSHEHPASQAPAATPPFGRPAAACSGTAGGRAIAPFPESTQPRKHTQGKRVKVHTGPLLAPPGVYGIIGRLVCPTVDRPAVACGGCKGLLPVNQLSLNCPSPLLLIPSSVLPSCHPGSQ